MGNSSSAVYETLSPSLQKEIEELYKKATCRYDFLKKNKSENESELKEQIWLDKEFMSVTHGAVHKGLRLKNIISKELRDKWDQECDDSQKTNVVNTEELVNDKNEIARKIQTEMFNKEARKQGFRSASDAYDSLGGYQKSKRSRRHKKSKKSKKKSKKSKKKSKKSKARS